MLHKRPKFESAKWIILWIARAKSEAPRHPKKVQSCNAERPRQPERQKKGLFSKKQLCMFTKHTFFLHFFAVVLHDYNVKLLSYTFYGGNVVCVPVRFFLKLSFSPLWPLAFLNFSPPLQNFQICLLTKFVSFVSYLSVRVN